MKSDNIGSKWGHNWYSGCACDIPSHSYSYGFALKHDWAIMSPGWDELHAGTDAVKVWYSRTLGILLVLRAQTRWNGQALDLDSCRMGDCSSPTHVGQICGLAVPIIHGGTVYGPASPHGKYRNVQPKHNFLFLNYHQHQQPCLLFLKIWKTESKMPLSCINMIKIYLPPKLCESLRCLTITSILTFMKNNKRPSLSSQLYP